MKSKSVKQLLLDIGEETLEVEGKQMSKTEITMRRIYKMAAGGDMAAARFIRESTDYQNLSEGEEKYKEITDSMTNLDVGLGQP